MRMHISLTKSFMLSSLYKHNRSYKYVFHNIHWFQYGTIGMSTNVDNLNISFSLRCIVMSLLRLLDFRSKTEANYRCNLVFGDFLKVKKASAKACNRKHWKRLRTIPGHKLSPWFLFYPLCGLLHLPWTLSSYSRIV